MVSPGQKKHKVMVYCTYIQCITPMKFNKHRTIEQPGFGGDASLPSMNASYGTPCSWALSVFKLAFLKSWVFVLLLVFSVLSRILNSML